MKKGPIPFCYNHKCTLANTASLKKHRCSKCQTTTYCGPACQQEDWQRHKIECVEYTTLSILEYLSRIEDHDFKHVAKTDQQLKFIAAAFRLMNVHDGKIDMTCDCMFLNVSPNYDMEFVGCAFKYDETYIMYGRCKSKVCAISRNAVEPLAVLTAVKNSNSTLFWFKYSGGKTGILNNGCSAYDMPVPNCKMVVLEHATEGPQPMLLSKNGKHAYRINYEKNVWEERVFYQKGTNQKVKNFQKHVKVLNNK
jgi:hypothetical protein